MRTPVAPGTLESVIRRRRRLIGIALAIAAVVVGGVLAYLALQPGPPVEILSVTISPDPGVPDQVITVTARVQGGSFLRPLSVSANSAAFFTGGPSGGGSMRAGGGDSFTGAIGPFQDGTAVWIVVVASDGQTVQTSAAHVVNVGQVVQGGPSGLRINAVSLSPPQPTSLDMPSVEVNVTGNASLSQVTIATMHFSASSGSFSSGSGLGEMVPTSSGNYTTPLFGMFTIPGGGGTAVGTQWLYRIGVKDATGNTALSPLYMFLVASPTA